MKSLDIYTDGACSGNPGRGGYGAVLVYMGKEKVISGGFKLTTNNRMEVYAAIAALEQLKEPCAVRLFSDSKYLVDAVEKGWAEKWRKSGWMRTKTERALNADLWERLLSLLARHRVTFHWVKGHASNHYNNRCDELAASAAQNEQTLADAGYAP
jgi:ribonuclease HI